MTSNTDLDYDIHQFGAEAVRCERHGITRTVMRWTTAIIVAAVVFFAGCFIAGELTPAQAAVTTVRTFTSADWAGVACASFDDYTGTGARHGTAHALYSMTYAAMQLPKSYLKADLLELAADLASPSKNAPKYVSVAVQYAGEDCLGLGTISGTYGA